MHSVIENIEPAKKVTTSQLARKRLLELVGNTPLIYLSHISREVAPVEIHAKAEWYNLGGSVKDRAALNMIFDGEKSGELTHAKTILDATSGNTGIAYAMIGALLGYRVKLTLPANAGRLFKQILKAYGAEIILTNPQHGSDGAIREAIRIYEEAPECYFYPDQYNNPANWLAHYEGTGAEIIRQTQGQITHFVAGLGSCGTFVGAGRRLKEFNDNIKLISVQPDSPLNGIEGLKHLPTAIIPGIYDPELADENIEITTEEAQKMVKHLAREEGLLVGVSSGAALAAALKVAKRLTSGCVVVIFPDSAYKYFDQRFWEENSNGH